MSLIVPRLYLGSAKEACNQQWLREHNIKLVINAAAEIDNVKKLGRVPFFQKLGLAITQCQIVKGIEYVKFDIKDLPTEKIYPYFDIAAKVIDDFMKTKRGYSGVLPPSILIHCQAGISRSATLVIYWIAKRKFKGDIDRAYKYVKSKRSIVNPNFGFWKQLQDTER